MDDLTVTLDQGVLRGIKKHSKFRDLYYYSYFGIPFATPPTGDLRFRAPLPAEPWTGILNATKESDECSQFSFIRLSLTGSEDCLHLNIHTSDLPSNVICPKPVLVCIHPGAYTWGSSSVSAFGSPEYIISPDIIYVTINYRLAAFGFLNFGVPECAGNMGLKDMVLALKWIKQNIHKFGGDPNNITAIGNSSSAGAVHLLLCSPLSKGLINKAILQGCHGICHKTYHNNALKSAYRLAQLLGYNGDDPHEAVTHLKDQPAFDIVRSLANMRTNYKNRTSGCVEFAPFLPSVEVVKENAFMDLRPVEFVQNIDPVPLIFGACNKEGMLIFSGDPWDALNNEFQDVVKKNLWQYKMDDEMTTEATTRLRSFYFNNLKSINPNTALGPVIDFYTDLWISEVYEYMIDIVLKKDSKTPVYVYEFGYDGQLNYAKINNCPYLVRSGIKVPGACHGDDISYWCSYGFPLEPNAKDGRVVKLMCSLFINFAKTGNPNEASTKVEWFPVNLNERYYLEIGKTAKLRSGKLNEARTNFWEMLLKDIYANEKRCEN